MKDSFLFQNRSALVLLTVLFLALAFLRIQFPDLDHGDEFSDANILSAGQNFAKFGFIRCRFLPAFEMNLKAPAGLYTHVPPLPDVLNGLWRMLFKTDSLVFFRAIALMVAFLNLLFWYLFVREFSGSVLFGFLAGLFYASNSMFLFCVDSLHQPSYVDMLRSLIFLLFLLITVSPERKSRSLWLVWALYFLSSLLSFEYLLYLAIFFIFFPLCFRKTQKSAYPKLFICLLMLAPLFGFLLHFLQNTWYFGSFSGAMQDLKRAAIERVVHSKDMPFGKLTFAIWGEHAIGRNFSLSFMFNYYLLSSMLFVAFFFYGQLAKETKQKIRPLINLWGLMLFCGVSWYVVFPAHTVAHTYVNFLGRHLVPAASLFFALFAYIIYNYVKEKHRRSPSGLAFFVLLVLSLAGAGILASQLPVTAESRAQSRDFLKFKDCLLRLKSISKPEAVIGVNYYRSPFLRYYTQRNYKSIFNREDLEAQTALPDYFIFLPYNDQRSLELLRLVQEKYVPLFQCSSLRFSAIFCKLKK